MAFKIFVSYSTRDLLEVHALKEEMANTPIEVFISEYSVSPGQELASNIDKAIKECDLFVVLLSQNTKNSDWVGQEIGKAIEQKKEILPLVLDEGIDPPGFISGRKYIPLFEDLEKGLEEAAQSIENAAQKQKDENRDIIIGIGIGAFLLWVLHQK